MDDKKNIDGGPVSQTKLSNFGHKHSEIQRKLVIQINDSLGHRFNDYISVHDQWVRSFNEYTVSILQVPIRKLPT